MGLKQDWRASLSERYALKWGLDLRSSTAKYDYFNRHVRERPTTVTSPLVFDTTTVGVSPKGNEIGFYLAQRIRPWTPLTLETGVRWDRQSNTGDSQISPRLNLALALDGRTTVRAA